MISEQGLLYIEPGQPASATPVIDPITRKMCAAFRKSRRSDYACGGIHNCFCGACSSDCDYHLPNGDLTNSLCIHYLAHHRAEVPQEQLARIAAFPYGEAEPNERELLGPQLILKGIRASLEKRLGPEGLRTWMEWGLDAEALCRALQNGYLNQMPICFTPERQDAEDLNKILWSLSQANALPTVQETVLRSYRDMKAWGTDALRVPGWKREAWVTPMLAAIRSLRDLEVGHSRRVIAMSFCHVGPHAGVAIPRLLQIAKSARGDLRYDVFLALYQIGDIPGVLVPAEAVPLLTDLAQPPSHDPELRKVAAGILKQLKN